MRSFSLGVVRSSALALIAFVLAGCGGGGGASSAGSSPSVAPPPSGSPAGVAFVPTAAAPVISGPSLTTSAAPAAFVGTGFAANTSVTLTIKAPSGNSSAYSAVTNDSGEVSYTLVPTERGAYTITVSDSGGRSLTSATVAALP